MSEAAARAERKRAARTLWGWDVEASDPLRPWDGATLAVVKSEHGDVERFIGDDCLERAAAHMQKARGVYAAHYGGGYDVPLLLNHWRPKKIVLSGSNILIAEEAWDLKLRDTFPWWLCGLKKIGEACGLEKLDVDRAHMERLTLDEQVTYCERDVDVLLRGIDEASAFLTERGAARACRGRVGTAGMSAAALVQALEPGSWAALTKHRCHVEDTMAMLTSGAVRGGRVEAHARGQVDGVHVYDIKSSYPARYAHRDVGIGLRRAEPHDTVGVWRCTWRWSNRRLIPPSLDQYTMCGAGDCEAWLIDDEIAAFEACGVKVARHEGWAPHEVLPIGQEFAAAMFAAKEGTSAARAFAKVFFNSWHGKATMSPLQEQFTSTLPKEYWRPGGSPRPVPEGRHGAWWFRYLTLAADRNGLLRPYQQPLMGALILGRARVAIWEIDAAVQRAGYPVLYNDTDSLMTTCPPEKMPLKLGNDLGELAHEGGPYTGYFLGPKAYCLVDEHGAVKKCALKGVPHRSYADGVFENGVYREARGIERLKGRGAFTRKGAGRDVRLELFERALSPAGASKALKDGLCTFLAGTAATETKEAGRWERTPVIRTVRPSGRGKVHHTETIFEYLACVEVNGAAVLAQLPEPLTTVWRKTNGTPASGLRPDFRPMPRGQATLAWLEKKELTELRHDDERVLPRLPRMQTETAAGKRVMRVDHWAAYSELKATAGIEDHDGAITDELYRQSQRHGGMPPGPWRGGELDSLKLELSDSLISCPYEGFLRLTRRARVWRDVLRAVEALREVPGFERLHVPLELVTPHREVLHATDKGRNWLLSIGPIWIPDDDGPDDDVSTEGSLHWTQ